MCKVIAEGQKHIHFYAHFSIQNLIHSAPSTGRQYTDVEKLAAENYFKKKNMMMIVLVMILAILMTLIKHTLQILLLQHKTSSFANTAK